MMTPVAGLFVSAGTITAVRNAKGTTLVLTGPFGPPNHPSISTRRQISLHGTKTKGVEVVARSPNVPHPKDYVNSVQFSRSVAVLNSSCSVAFYVVVSLVPNTHGCGQFPVNVAPYASSICHSITGAAQQDLVLPSSFKSYT